MMKSIRLRQCCWLAGICCPPVQHPCFNMFPLDGTVPDDLIYEMIDHSYAAVVKKLPKYLKRSLAVCNLQ